MPARAKELGIRAVERLRPLVDGVEHVADVRGYGLEMGIELTDENRDPLPYEEMAKLTRKLLSRGVFAEPSALTSTLLIMPPL